MHLVIDKGTVNSLGAEDLLNYIFRIRKLIRHRNSGLAIYNVLRMNVAAASSYALVAAILFAFGIHSQKSALANLDDLTGTFVSVATIAVLFWMIGGWSLEWSFWLSEATPYFIIAGVFFPALGQRFQISAVKNVGPSLTSAFSAFLPLLASIPAFLFLGEKVTLLQTVGIALLSAGLLLGAIGRGISWRKREFYLLLLPLGSAVVRAISQPIAKAGYNILAEPIFATLLMATVSTVVVGTMLILAGKTRSLLNVGRGHALFALNGVFIGSGILALQLSLVNGSVALATSLISTAPIWVLALAFLLKNERIHWWHGVVAIFACVGAILIVVGQEVPWPKDH